MIPSILFRVVPEKTSEVVEHRWEAAGWLHPDWYLATYRDPLMASDFPITSPHWDACSSGAQLAGLVRLEALYNHGGIYVDSDVDLIRTMEPLRGLRAFAAWEDRHTVPDAVIGAEANHPAIYACLEMAVARVEQGAWASGPGVTTAVLPHRFDVVCLSPESFYPYHYSEKATPKANEDYSVLPWCYGVHRWAGSWL